MNNDEKVRTALENPEIPAELEPDRIKAMLDEHKHSAKRRKIFMKKSRIIASAAACAVIVGSTAGYMHFSKPERNSRRSETTDVSKLPGKVNEPAADQVPEQEQTSASSTGSYMTAASDYGQIYELFGESYDSAVKTNEKNSRRYQTNGIMTDGFAYEEAEEADAEVSAAAPSADTPKTVGFSDNGSDGSDDGNYYVVDDSGEPEPSEPIPTEPEPTTDTTQPPTEDTTEPTTEEDTTEPATEEGDGEEDFSETYNQEKDVLEADIVKTDGKNIYYLTSEYDNSVLRVASVDKGEFTGYTTVDLKLNIGSLIGGEYEKYIYVEDMYLYNGMIEVIGSVNCYREYDTGNGYNNYEYKSVTFVSFYTAGDEPQYIDTFCQDGYYNDVRISPDGFMYLISNYSTMTYADVEDEKNTSRYIPSCGNSDDICCIEPDHILLPEEGFKEQYTLDYMVVSGIDLTNEGSYSVADTKALAGFAGTIYQSPGNLYTAYGWEDTEITRFAISLGHVDPVASGKVEGWVNDQFSMSEYNGYFRVATTKEQYNERFHRTGEIWEFWDTDGYYSYDLEKRDNRVYVLDMGMNIVGSIGDFGIDESVKSVNFDRDMAYVVTYEQTDPLFAIDLSDPTAPKILDEYKILGYSTYMQNWSDGRLFGFGPDADENGRVNGVKLVMFDNSDPSDLKEKGLYAINGNDEINVYSCATYDRKALLIAPEKNIIGVPVETYDYMDYYYKHECRYMFFSYSGEAFELLGETRNMDGTNRAIYIGNYVYILSADRFVSLDMETFEEHASIDF